MNARARNPMRELIALHRRAAEGERNLGAHISAHPALVAALGGSVDLEKNDGELARVIAPAVERLKRSLAHVAETDRLEQAVTAAARLTCSARHEGDRVVLDADHLLGPLASGTHKYVVFATETARVAVPRHILAKARRVLRGFIDLAAFVDDRGVHLRWRAGRGALNLLPQREERAARLVEVDLRPRRQLERPRPIGHVLAEAGLISTHRGRSTSPALVLTSGRVMARPPISD